MNTQINLDASIQDNAIQKNIQIQNVPANLSGQDLKQKTKLPYKGDYVEKVLSKIIVNSKGKPDWLAVSSSNHKTQFQQSRKFLSRISDNIK